MFCVLLCPNSTNSTLFSVAICLPAQYVSFPFVRYKNEELITPASEPGKYRIESKYGVHVLEINR